jgi:magnesium-dependent phosphatase 1
MVPHCDGFLSIRSSDRNRPYKLQHAPTITALFAASNNPKKPKLIVFDLDGCLWKPELYELARRRRKGDNAPPQQSPFVPLAGGNRCRSQGGSVVTLHADVPSILHELATAEEWSDTQLAISSRTDQPEWARELLGLFALPASSKKSNDTPQTLQEVISGPWEMVSTERKVLHFERLSEQTNIPLEQMMFFDNDIGNCKSVSRMGVTVGLAAPLTRTIFERTMAKYPVKWGVVGLEVK